MTTLHVAFRAHRRNVIYWKEQAKKQGKSLTEYLREKLPVVPEVMEKING